MVTLYILYGIQAIAYIIVTFIQKSQIKSMEGKFENVEKYVKIINIDELKKYAELTKENAKHEAMSVVHAELATFKYNQGVKYDRLFTFAVEIIGSFQTEEEKVKFVKSQLPELEADLIHSGFLSKKNP